MKDRIIQKLIHLLGGYTKQEHELLSKRFIEESRLLNRANAIINDFPPYCNLTEGCVMQDGHLGGCRDISGLCFSTLHTKELRRQRKERETANVL